MKENREKKRKIVEKQKLQVEGLEISKNCMKIKKMSVHRH